MSALATVCRGLRHVAMEFSQTNIREARASIDRAVDAWERASACADASWAAGVDCHTCIDLNDDDDNDGDDVNDSNDSNDEHHHSGEDDMETTLAPEAAARQSRLIRKATHVARGRDIVSTFDSTLLCDECSTAAVAQSPSGDFMVDRVDLRAPHIWRDYHDNYAPSHAIDNDHFIVPAPLVHSIDADAAARFVALNTASPFYFYANGTPLGVLPSARSWLPLVAGGACPFNLVDYEGLFVCCDASHPAWGSIAIATANACRLNGFVVTLILNKTLAARYRQRGDSQRDMDITSWLACLCYEADDLPIDDDCA